jgi:hypothetical protein
MVKDSGGVLLFMDHVEGTGTEESRGFLLLLLLLFTNQVEAVKIKQIVHVIVQNEDIDAEYCF